MTTSAARPAIANTVPPSWVVPHGEYICKELRSQGHDEESATTTLATALIEEAGSFTAAYTRWISDPQRVAGIADLDLALAGLTVSAYALAHQMGVRLDHWIALKLRHVYAEIDSRR